MTAKQKRFWMQFGVVAVVWALFGLFNAWVTHYRWSLAPKPYSWASALYVEMSYSLCGAVATPLVLWLARRYRLERTQFIRNLLFHAVSSFLYASVVKLMWDALGSPAVHYYGASFTFDRLFQSVNYGLDEGIPLYWVIVLLDHALEYYRRYQAGRIEASELQSALVKAQLQALRMQLNPHFLFNTLHAISSLVREDPENAERMIARLSDLLRLSLDSCTAQEVSLEQELRFLDVYLEIERMRFEERLTIEFQIDPAAAGALVPNFILQPMLENAIRHGVSHRLEGGRIVVSASLHNDNVVLKVTDNGPGLPADDVPRAREGVGLSSTRARLERLYGHRQFVHLHAAPGGGAEVVISIPFVTTSVFIA